MGGIIVLVLVLWMLIQIPYVQNRLVDYTTKTISRNLNIPISIGSVNFSLFNKFAINDLLVKDRSNDTLLHAGQIRLNISNWFFLKKDIVVSYAGLENVYINTYRKDSTWNYQFILDAFSSGKTSNGKPTDLKLNITALDLKKIRYKVKDQWRGEDQDLRISKLSLSADLIDLQHKKIQLNNLVINQPYFGLHQYTGKRPRSLIPKTEKRINGKLYWNPGQWTISAKSISLEAGNFKSDLETSRKTYDYFDGAHMHFSAINAGIKNLELNNDSLSGQLSLKIKERSGFEVRSLLANVKMDPTIMAFTNLSIETPYSKIGNAFSMGYDYFTDDMADFVNKVRMEGNIANSILNLKDIAFFAPALKDENISLGLNGKVQGAVKDLVAKEMMIEYGNLTTLSGELQIEGLPDVAKTSYRLTNATAISAAKDLYTLLPSLKKSLGIDLVPMGAISFKGDVIAQGENMEIKGLLNTALGSVNTITNLKQIGTNALNYSSTGTINGLEAGKLLNIKQLGNIAGKYSVSGNAKAGIKFNANLSNLAFNQYNYTDINARGSYLNDILETALDIDDKNLVAALSTSINLGGKMPRTVVDAQIHLSNLKALNLTSMPLTFSGKTQMDLIGNNPDNINGIARFTNLSVFRGNQAFVFDSLTFRAEQVEDYRSLTLLGKDIDAKMQGHFEFAELPATFNQYFSSYYPLYFKKSAPLKKDQDLVFSFELKNAASLLQILDIGVSGLNYSNIEGDIDTKNKHFNLTANIPKLVYKNLSIYDFEMNAAGGSDSLVIASKTSSVVFNDSLFFPNNEIRIRSSKNVSVVDINTFSESSQYGAKLSASVNNLKDGILVHFNPSSLVFNEKTWNIEKDSEVLISKAKFDASNFRLTNGEQSIGLITLPPAADREQTIILTLEKVNLGDLLPFVLKEPRIQGITSGDLTIEDPFNNLKLYLNAQTDKTRFENDSIGLTSINAFWDSKEKQASYFLESKNLNYQFGVKGKLDLKDSSQQKIETDIDVVNVKLSLLQPYLGIVFSQMDGLGNGKLRISGNLKEPDFTGAVKVSNAKVTVAYTQCSYTLADPVIEFSPGKINLGTIQLKDANGNLASVKGSLDHHFFRDFSYNISATSKKLLVLNTGRTDNNLFYGKAIAKFNFNITGPENQIKMYVSGAPVDSSIIDILTSTSSKQAADVDYIVWRSYGDEMKMKASESISNLIIDLDLTASPLLKMNVVLDELTGDVISGQGNGNLNIHTGTKENLSMIGRFNIESGSYNFNFQDVFKKPFKLLGGGRSYISWTGDPLNAEINIDALYLAEKVRMSTLFTDPSSSTVSGVSADVLREISDVEVRCNLSGTLSSPNPTFQIAIPQNSTVRNNATIDSKLKNINRDPLEVSKQSTYLIVFKSFAPQAAVVSSNLNSELLNTTISGVINGILASSVQNFFSKVLGSTVDVNFNYSRTMTGITGSTGNTGSGQNNFRENVSLQFIKSMLDDKLIITFGSDFNFAAAGGNTFTNSAQSFLFLPDVNVEYKITPDGKFRTSFFYRSSFDMLSTSGKRDRTGGNVSFRTEFDRFFERKKRVKPTAALEN